MISLEALRAELAAAGDPERAASQERYMKAVMPYHGLSQPELRALLRPHLRAYAPQDRDEWEATVRAWWDDAAFREEQYAALAVARHRSARPCRTSARSTSTATWSSPAPGGTSST